MRTHNSVYVATSIDGFIARQDGDIDWLNAIDSKIPEGEDCGWSNFIKDIDVIIMGRKSFEKALSFGGDWPYQQLRMIILSSNPVQIPDHLLESVSQSNEAPRALSHRLYQQGIKRTYVDGGSTVQGFLKEDLIDAMTITTIPVLIGSGIRLFGSLDNDLNFEMVDSKAYPFGLVQTQFDRIR